jgi:ribose 5-phosphate isomerase B
MEIMNIGLACDHAGFELKEKVVKYLNSKGIETTDFGTFSNESCDYPDFAHKLATAVENGQCYPGISICGSGNGINITVNKHAKIRSALCWMPEIARLARAHNNANILAMPARFISEDTAYQIIDAFLTTDFEGGRHQIRIDKI